MKREPLYWPASYPSRTEAAREVPEKIHRALARAPKRRMTKAEIERATGALRIAKAYSVLECGQALVPELVLGQAQAAAGDANAARGSFSSALEALRPTAGEHAPWTRGASEALAHATGH